MNVIMNLMVAATVSKVGVLMLQSITPHNDSAMMRASAMATFKTLNSELERAIPEIDTAARDAQTILDLYGMYMTPKEKVPLLEFINAAQNASMYSKRAKYVTNRFVTKGIMYPRDIGTN